MGSIPNSVKSAMVADDLPIGSDPSTVLHIACNDVFRKSLHERP